MQARVSNVNSFSEMKREMEHFECDALYTYLSKGVAIASYPSDYGTNKKRR